MGVVSIRIPDDMEEALEAAGIQPSSLAKAALEAEARRLAVMEQVKWFDSHRFKATRPIEDILREIRDNE
ncbi:MAG: hypothetical protein LC620_06835 [Halobacteriales archaeon]|nr:hypothetical protein [Halobacteriales archaeon]